MVGTSFSPRRTVSFQNMLMRATKAVSTSGEVAKPLVAGTAGNETPAVEGAPKKPYAEASNLSGPVDVQDIVPLTSRIRRDRSFIRWAAGTLLEQNQRPCSGGGFGIIDFCIIFIPLYLIPGSAAVPRFVC